jgi:Transposase IS116/IS110/IS902 family
MSSTLYLKQSGRLSENRTHKPGFVNIRKSMTTRLLLTLMLFVVWRFGCVGLSASHQCCFRRLYELLTSMPGVGAVLAFTLIALLPELGKMSRKQIAALVGLAPYDFGFGGLLDWQIGELFTLENPGGIDAN